MHAMRRCSGSQVSRPAASANRGFTLLEVILALVILSGSIALLGEAMRLGSRAATDAARETRAQVLAASVLDQLLAGALEMQEVDQEPLETDQQPSWHYSVAFLPCETEELRCVEVVVEQEAEPGQAAPRFRLVRWMPLDPNAAFEADTEAETASDRSGDRDA